MKTDAPLLTALSSARAQSKDWKGTLCLTATLACLFLLFGCSNARTNPNWNPNIEFSSGNLLLNPAASGAGVTPPWSQSITVGTGTTNTGTGTWILRSGPEVMVVSGSITKSINTADNSQWFLNRITLNSAMSCGPGVSCSQYTTITLSQSVTVSTLLAQHTRSPYFVYGGDAFATGTAYWFSSNGNWSAQAMETAFFTIQFKGSGGQNLGQDTSGDIFGATLGCQHNSVSKSNYGFRKNFAVIPAGTTSIVFTATIVDHLAACNSLPGQSFSQHRNGLDNLWLEFRSKL
jgi:hypothetical protein